MDKVSSLNTVPVEKWVREGEVIKFWGDNVDKKQVVRDMRSDHKSEVLHMFSMLAGLSRTPAPQLSHMGQVAQLKDVKTESFLPSVDDARKTKSNLIILVSRILTEYIDSMAPLGKSIPKHIEHRYSKEMAKKSEVVVLDVQMKNEACHRDMIEIMRSYQNYIQVERIKMQKVPCGGDQLTCERQVGSKRHMMCGNTGIEQLEYLEPVTEDWHGLVCMLKVSDIPRYFSLLK